MPKYTLLIQSRFLLLMVMAFTMTNCKKTNPDHVVEDKPLAQATEFYQLKVYTFDTDEQVKTTDKYLKEVYLPRLKKLNTKQVGVFKLRPNETDSVKKTFVLIPFSSLEQFLTISEELGKDETYLASESAYISASYQEPPYQRIESTLLKAFADMPNMQAPGLEGDRSQRVYELRSYESATERYYRNKVDMFNAGGEIKLFNRLEFNAVFYAEVISGAKMPNLMYMTTFSSQTSRDAHWKAFFDSPEWKELKAMPKYENNVSHADIIFLYPTEYSDY